MTRIKRGVIANKRKKNILKKTKGYRYDRSHKFRAAKNAWLKAKVYSYRDRRNKKRSFRQLWNIRISAGLKEYKMNYSQFIKALKVKKIELDRKSISSLAQSYPKIFKVLVQEVKK
jgi:large subunit ribosomal protein L20